MSQTIQLREWRLIINIALSNSLFRASLILALSTTIFACKTVDDSSLRFVGGEVPEEGKFPATVKIAGKCTAARIGPKMYLTAAHCLYGGRGELLPDYARNGTIEIVHGHTEETLTRYQATIDQVFIHPSAVEKVAENSWAMCGIDKIADLAVFTTQNELPDAIKPAAISDEALSRGDFVLIGGSGARTDHATDRDGNIVDPHAVAARGAGERYCWEELPGWMTDDRGDSMFDLSDDDGVSSFDLSDDGDDFARTYGDSGALPGSETLINNLHTVDEDYFGNFDVLPGSTHMVKMSENKIDDIREGTIHVHHFNRSGQLARAAAGDSGGPVYVKRRGEHVIVGVNSYNDGGDEMYEGSSEVGLGFVRIDSNSIGGTWLARVLRGEVSPYDGPIMEEEEPYVPPTWEVEEPYVLPSIFD